MTLRPFLTLPPPKANPHRLRCSPFFKAWLPQRPVLLGGCRGGEERGSGERCWGLAVLRPGQCSCVGAKPSSARDRCVQTCARGEGSRRMRMTRTPSPSFHRELEAKEHCLWPRGTVGEKGRSAQDYNPGCKSHDRGRKPVGTRRRDFPSWQSAGCSQGRLPRRGDFRAESRSTSCVKPSAEEGKERASRGNSRSRGPKMVQTLVDLTNWRSDHSDLCFCGPGTRRHSSMFYQ